MIAIHHYWQKAQTFGELLTNASQEAAAEVLIPIAETYVAKLIRADAVPREIDRDDLMQEARLAVVKAVQAYKSAGGRSLKSFLFFVLHRHIMRYIRHQVYTRQRRVPLATVEHTLSDEFPGMLTHMASQELEPMEAAAFQRLLDLLPPGWRRGRQILTLKYRDNCTEREIAHQLGLCARSVRRIHAQSVQRLREVCHAG